jgi:lipopolysaccharide/colanic/teichoic acid biosynthesis glycosyltransferase
MTRISSGSSAESAPPSAPRETMTTDRSKRAFDLGLAIPVLVLSLPVQAVVAVLVAARMGRPVLFRQRRPGLHGLPFTMYKFRTMRPLDVSQGWTTDAERLTPLGGRLRTLSLDELPSLWNVIKGDMSLVGPRPLLMEYVDRYTPEQSQRHHVRPGLTGLAQVSGRNALSWQERLRLDVEYVKVQSLRLDLRILALTLRSVARREGITAEGHATMEEFRGTVTGEDA